MEENNRVKNEKVLKKVQGGVNITGAAANDLANSLASQLIGVSVPVNKDAKNSIGGNKQIFKR